MTRYAPSRSKTDDQHTSAHLTARVGQKDKLREVAGEYRDQALRLMALQLKVDHQERPRARRFRR